MTFSIVSNILLRGNAFIRCRKVARLCEGGIGMAYAHLLRRRCSYNRCPFCHSYNCYVYSETYEMTSIEVHRSCLECGKKWKEKYELFAVDEEELCDAGE